MDKEWESVTRTWSILGPNSDSWQIPASELPVLKEGVKSATNVLTPLVRFAVCNP
jgi:hypothetical protein